MFSTLILTVTVTLAHLESGDLTEYELAGKALASIVHRRSESTELKYNVSSLLKIENKIPISDRSS